MISLRERLSTLWWKARFAASHPAVARERLKVAAVRPLARGRYETVAFAEEDWDTLVVLDGCRYDLMAELDPFDAPVRAVNSNASHTTDFLKQNFSSWQPTTVYISASPQLVGYENTFVHLEHVWQDHWDETLRTVRPESVTDAAIGVAKSFPKKRYVVHYMQPHYPFVGPTGRELGDHATFTGGHSNRLHTSVWEQLACGELDVSTVWAAYRENLKLAIPEVERLANAVDGKTVVTSDHGNLFGKRVSILPFSIYGHPPRLHDEELTRVPWVVLPYSSRRCVTADPPSSDQDSTRHSTVNQRLRDLGYRP